MELGVLAIDTDVAEFGGGRVAEIPHHRHAFQGVGARSDYCTALDGVEQLRRVEAASRHIAVGQE
ncbi:hypothetical protein D9M69_720120 [compost metagenome]